MVDNEVTYWEYWLSRKVWSANDAILLIVDYMKFHRTWFPYEDCWKVVSRLREEIESKLNDERPRDIFHKYSFRSAGYDKVTGDWIEGELVLDDCNVHPKEFLLWIHSKGYEMPYDFKVFIGVAEMGMALTPKREYQLDKAVCQAVAKTLWDEHPDMTIEKMQFTKAVQVYGGGKGYPGENTLRTWLREVDTRENKPGPKKA